MKSHYRVVVIGGGVVGASVLYHLAKLGWSRHRPDRAQGADRGLDLARGRGLPRHQRRPQHRGPAGLYDQPLQAARGGERAEHRPAHDRRRQHGGHAERWEWLKSAAAIFKTMGLDHARLVTPDEIKELCPICDVSGLYGGLYDADEGYLDPYGTTHAYVAAARKRGADLVLRNRVLELHARARRLLGGGHRAGHRSAPSTWSMPAACGPSRSG